MFVLLVRSLVPSLFDMLLRPVFQHHHPLREGPRALSEIPGSPFTRQSNRIGSYMNGPSWSRMTISPAASVSFKSAHLKDSFVVVPVDNNQQ